MHVVETFTKITENLFRSSHQRYSIKRDVLKTSKNSRENTCARYSFLIKLQTSGLHFIKKETLIQVFSCEFSKIFKNTFFREQLWMTSSEHCTLRIKKVLWLVKVWWRRHWICYLDIRQNWLSEICHYPQPTYSITKYNGFPLGDKAWSSFHLSYIWFAQACLTRFYC